LVDLLAALLLGSMPIPIAAPQALIFIAVFTKDGGGSHHAHSLEYSELKVPSEVSQDPLGVKL